MRVYRVVMRKGTNIDIEAEFMLDDPTLHDVIYFYHDEARNMLAGTVKRDEVAGLIFLPDNSSAAPRHRKLIG